MSNIEKYILCSSSEFHEISYHNDADTVKVKVWVSKKQFVQVLQEPKKDYVFRSKVPDSTFFDINYCEFFRKNSKQIDRETLKPIESDIWQKIDSYICLQGNGSISTVDFEDCWRQRLYVLPLMYLQNKDATAILSDLIKSRPKGTTRFDIYQRKSFDQLKELRDSNFLKFMEFLNKVTHVENKRITSSSCKNASLLPSRKEKLDNLLTQYHNNENHEENKLNIVNYLKKTYQQSMINNIPFLAQKSDLPPNCFISAECTWWCIQNIQDVNTEEDAIDLLQTMLEFNIIKHINKTENTYIHGFYFYYILTEENCKIPFLFTRNYCEVGLIELNRGLVFDEKNLFKMKKIPKKNELLPMSGNEYSNNEIFNIVNVDVDSQKRSTRIEWASALYRCMYHPLCAFELEIYWKMATAQLLSELINNWTKKSSKFNYHIIPGPVDPFATPFNLLR